ncbi:MAG: hypothetical protein NTZ30_00735 [Planctomycetota bacterium]|nr:hypothetical protein [Planctomycetota bacterium]
MKKPNSACGSKSFLMVLFASLIGFVCPACMQDGHLKIFRYTTKTNFDSNIRTVRVPLFKNNTFTPGGGAGQGLENELTLAVIREIESEAETNLAVQIVWKDLRTGDILSRPKADLNKGTPVALGGNPNVQPDTTPVLVTSLTSFIPELGQSITSARKTNVDVLATQIVAMMEIPW